MKSNNDLYPLGDYVKIQGGYSYPSGEFGPAGIPVLKIKNIRFRNVDVSDVQYVSTELAKETEDYYVQNGNVLISMTGSHLSQPDSMVGRVARYAGKSNKYLLNQRTGRFQITKPNLLDERYLFYTLTSPEYQYLLASGAGGSANQANISAKQIYALKIPVLDIKTQKAIAYVLGTLDDNIELNRKMNETLEAMARAIFKSWFVDFDPVRAKAEGRRPFGMDAETAALFPDSFQDSPLGKIPKGWEASSCGDEFDITMGQSPPGKTYNEDGVGMPFFQGRRDFGYRFPTNRVYCTEPKRIGKSGDTLVSVRAPVGDINIALSECCVGRGVAAVRHNSGSISYTYYSMQSLAEDFARFEAEGTVFGAINKKGFTGIGFVKPSPDIIARYDSICGPIDRFIENNVRESRTLAAIRDTLLPKLLSGEIRIKDPEKFLRYTE